MPKPAAVGPALDFLNGDDLCTRLVVVSAHPGDESLGFGGLISTAYSAGLTVYVVLLTAGESSAHAPASAGRHALATLRLAKLENALAALAPDAPLVFLGALDGRVAESELAIGESLAELIGDGHRTLLVSPWRHDGHPDHDAAGRAAADAARRTSAKLIESPVRGWRHPDRGPWPLKHRLDLTDEARQAKARAIAALGMPNTALARCAGEVEHYVVNATHVSIPDSEASAG